MPEAVIVDAIRTPIGRAGKGSLKSIRADDLAARRDFIRSRATRCRRLVRGQRHAPLITQCLANKERS